MEDAAAAVSQSQIVTVEDAAAAAVSQSQIVTVEDAAAAAAAVSQSQIVTPSIVFYGMSERVVGE